MRSFYASSPLKKNVIYTDSTGIKLYWSGSVFHLNEEAQECVDILGYVYVKEGSGHGDINEDAEDTIHIYESKTDD